jgi:hypothetical protein
MKNTRKNLLKKRKHMSKKHMSKKHMSKKHMSKKHMSKKHLPKKDKSRKYKGGYGLGANPFPRHPGAWNVDNMGNYFLFNPHGQVTGSPDPFFGKTVPQPQMTYSAFKSGLTPYQKGGMLGQGLVNLYRNGMNSVVNNAPFLGRVYRGKHPIVSPSPTVQPAMRTKTIIPGPLPNIKEIRYNSKTLASKY